MAICLAATVLLLDLAAVSPTIHAWLHGAGHGDACCGSRADEDPAEPDEDEAGHYCGVGILLVGAVFATHPSVMPAGTVPTAFEKPVPETAPPGSGVALPGCRGPPV